MDYLSEVYDVGYNTCRPTDKSKLNVPLKPSLFESAKLSSRWRNVALEEKREDKKRVMKFKRVAELNIELKNIELQKSILHEKQSDLDDRVQVIKWLKTSIWADFVFSAS